MTLAEYVRTEGGAGLKPFSLHRFGYRGALDDTAALAEWLEANPSVNAIGAPAPPQAHPLRTVQARPGQEELRRRIGDAYGWRCALTDCPEPSALQAAHLRDWRKHNRTPDGILLRADLHGLLDGGNLMLFSDRTVKVMSPFYAFLGERKIRFPKCPDDWPKLPPPWMGRASGNGLLA